MNRAFLGIAAVIIVAGAGGAAFAQNLVPNGDFEDVQVDEFGEPALDAYGLEQPVAWFRSTTDPGTVTTPGTELISPANMNNVAGNNLGDDSDGAGTNSIALNYVPDTTNPPLGIGMDWRSEAFDTNPGEVLIFSFAIKFIGVSQDEIIPGSGFFEGGLAQVRSFTEQAPDGGTSGTFKGELNVGFESRNFTPDVWHTVSSPLVVPTEGEWTDIRISTNLFSPPFHVGGQILFDKVTVQRLTADFDDDGDVDATDLTFWQPAFGTTAVGDADGDGDSDGADFLAWQQQLGLDGTPVAATAGSIPEPTCGALAMLGGLALISARRGRRELPGG
jgi:hypothetical protein